MKEKLEEIDQKIQMIRKWNKLLRMMQLILIVSQKNNMAYLLDNMDFKGIMQVKWKTNK